MPQSWSAGYPKAASRGGEEPPWKRQGSTHDEIAAAILVRLPFEIKERFEWRVDQSGESGKTTTYTLRVQPQDKPLSLKLKTNGLEGIHYLSINSTCVEVGIGLEGRLFVMIFLNTQSIS